MPEKRIRHHEGVYTRQYDSGKETLYIQFRFKGVKCQEPLPGLNPNKKQDIKIACGLKSEIQRKIELESFLYSDYFPDSPRAKKFGHQISSQTLEGALRSGLQDMQRILAPSTYKTYAKAVEKIWIPRLGQVRIVDLTPEHFREAIRTMNVTRKTMTNYLLPVRQVLDEAVDDSVIAFNPLDRIKVKRLVPKKSTGYVVDPYSEEEIKILLQGFADHRPGWLNYFTFMFYTGARPSEAYALSWPEIDFLKGTAHILDAVVERVRQDRTKTEASTRDIILLPAALQALNTQKPLTFLSNGTIFRNPRTNKPIIDYQESMRAWDFVHQKIGMRRRNQYQTRHSYASNLLSQGENILKVADQMGHGDLEMLMRIYAKWIDQGRDKIPGEISFGQAEEKTSVVHT